MAATLDRIARELAARGLRPVIDRDLGLVACDCPDCRAQDTDPLAIWRPLRAVPRDGRVSFACGACGRGAMAT